MVLPSWTSQSSGETTKQVDGILHYLVGSLREDNGWEAFRKDKGGLPEEAPFSCSLNNEKGPVMKWERKQAGKR